MVPHFHVALVEPAIPQNAGNVGRLALAFGARLHLVGKLGFSTDEKACRRAGLDYWKHVDQATWPDFESFEKSLAGARLWLFSAHGKTTIEQADFRAGDALVFGNEARGLPRQLVDAARERSVRIPIQANAVRSLNLANAVSIGLYEASRKLGFPPVALSPEVELALADEARDLASGDSASRDLAPGEPGRPARGTRAAIKELTGAGLVENRRRGPRS